MDLSLPISYNSLSINTAVRSATGRPTSGYIVESFEPIPPDAVGFVEKRALQDGLDASDVFLGGRLFRLIVTPMGTSKADFWDKTQDLLHAFSARIAFDTDSANKGFLALDFTQPTADIVTWPTSAYSNGIPMRYYVRPITSPQYTVVRDRDGGSGGHSKPFNITLLARDPRKYLQTEQSVSLSTSTQTATYRGDYPTFPVVTFSLSAAGHSAFTIVVNTNSLVINLSSDTSGTFTADYGKGTITRLSTGNSQWSLVTSGTLGHEVDVGSTFRMANTTGISSSVIAYREAFA